jgi:cobaltochelatase CobT
MHTLLENDLERLARTLVDRFGVEVVCKGDNAYTDGQRIVLPSMPDPLDEGLERMMVGYLDHEIAHVAFSDFQVAAEFEKRHPGRLGMLNVVEDALIERKAMQRWPGVRRNLDRLFAQVRDRVLRLIRKRGAVRSVLHGHLPAALASLGHARPRSEAAGL